MEPVTYDPFSPEVLADPHRAHAELRARCPVHHFAGHGLDFWTVAGHAEVTEVMRDVATWSSRHGQGPAFQRNAAGMLAAADPPEHTWHRRLVQKSFTPAAIATLEPHVHRLTHDLLDAVVPQGAADLHDALAYPLPVIVIAELLGVSPGDRARFKHWSDHLVAALGHGVRPDRAVHEEFQGYFRREIRWRRAALARGEPLPRDLVSDLVAHDDDQGRTLDDDQVLGLIAQLLVAGNETTTSLITNLLWRLLERPALLERLRADPALDEVAVEESLRFDPPVLGLFRTNDRPVRLGGVDLPTDTKVMALYASANRDPAVWDRPDEFSLDRDPVLLRRHYGFGTGVHYCLGAPLARLEARIALRAVLDRLPGLRLTGRPERIEPFFLWGRRTLPVAWEVS